MRCPKCHQEQNNTVECDHCGVIFARYQKVQEHRQQIEAEKAEASDKRRLPLILSLALLVVLVALLVMPLGAVARCSTMRRWVWGRWVCAWLAIQRRRCR